MSDAAKGGNPLLVENIRANWLITIYKKLKKIPIPSGRPTPPLTFLEDKATPISVNTNAERG